MTTVAASIRRSVVTEKNENRSGLNQRLSAGSRRNRLYYRRNCDPAHLVNALRPACSRHNAPRFITGYGRFADDPLGIQQ
jgi:hypothetical protein